MEISCSASPNWDASLSALTTDEGPLKSEPFDCLEPEQLRHVVDATRERCYNKTSGRLEPKGSYIPRNHSSTTIKRSRGSMRVLMTRSLTAYLGLAGLPDCYFTPALLCSTQRTTISAWSCWIKATRRVIATCGRLPVAG